VTRPRFRKQDRINGLFLSLLIALACASLATLRHFCLSSNTPYGVIVGNGLIMTCVMMRLDMLQHESCHFLLFSSKKINNAIGDWICSIPQFSELSSYRAFHFDHHRFLGDMDKDPEVPFYHAQRFYYRRFKKREFMLQVFLDITGFHFLEFNLKVLKSMIMDHEYNALFKIVMFHGILLSTLGLKTYWLGWILPMMTLKFACSKIQGLSEHFPYNRPTFQSGRILKVNGFITFLIFPMNAAYHLVHHLKPNIPWFELPMFARRLKTWDKLSNVSIKNFIRN
jgi:fatty acid desaturase